MTTIVANIFFVLGIIYFTKEIAYAIISLYITYKSLKLRRELEQTLAAQRGGEYQEPQGETAVPSKGKGTVH